MVVVTRSAMASLTRALLVTLACSCDALSSMALRSPRSSRAPARSVRMSATPPLESLLAPDLAHSAAVALSETHNIMLPSQLLSDGGVFELINSFGNTPLVLLIPIGAGTVVAFGIIFILVKSVG